MTEFYLAGAALLALAIVIVLLAARSRAASGRDQHLYAQQRFFHQRLRELQAERDNGQLDEVQLATLERELKRQLVSETDQRPDYREVPSKGRFSLYLLLILLPLLALGIYSQLGHQADLKLRDLQRQIASGEQLSAGQFQRFEAQLEKALAQRPESPDHLAMMAGLRREAGDFAGAAPYYQRLLALFPNDPDLMAQLAQARYLANDRQLTAPVRSLLDSALALNPQQSTALGVLGIDAFAKGDYANAIGYWQRLLPALPPASAEAAMIRDGLDAAKRRALESGELEGIEVAVSVDETLGPAPRGVLFVVAKAEDGNPMPVAALRREVNADSWPINMTLTDGDVIRAGKQLDDFETLSLSAHISLAGTAIRQPGDWTSAAQTLVMPVTEPLQLHIERIRPGANSPAP